MRRLLLGSGLIMFVGFIAVFGAILYKTLGPSKSDVSRAAIGTRLVEQALPQGAEVTGIALNGEELAVSFKAGDGGNGVLLINRADWSIAGKLILQSENR